MRLSTSLFAQFHLLVLALAVAASTSCSTGGIGHATADSMTEPVKWRMLQHPGIPTGRPISGGPSLIKVVNPVRETVLVVFSTEGRTGSFFVEKGQAVQRSVSNGRFRMLFVFGDEPDTLYRGDDVPVWNGISTITLQGGPRGNYNIRKIR